MKDQDPDMRRCQRVLSMVLELHKRGYQNLAVFSGISPCGCHWRCGLMPFDWLMYEADGWLGCGQPDSVDYARYTSASSNHYFGWEDAEQDTARQLADKFEDRFPELCRRVLGANYAYSGWLTYMVGMSERGSLPVMYQDYGEFEYDWIKSSGTTGGRRLASPPHPRKT